MSADNVYLRVSGVAGHYKHVGWKGWGTKLKPHVQKRAEPPLSRRERRERQVRHATSSSRLRFPQKDDCSDHVSVGCSGRARLPLLVEMHPQLTWAPGRATLGIS